MSVINKKPYAQKVIESLDKINLDVLLTLMNTSGGYAFKSFINDDLWLPKLSKATKLSPKRANLSPSPT